MNAFGVYSIRKAGGKSAVQVSLRNTSHGKNAQQRAAKKNRDLQLRGLR